MLGLPFMYDALLEHQRKRPRNLSSLRRCICGGDVVPSSCGSDFEATFGAPLRNFWASTEACGAFRPGSQPGPVSRIAPGAQIRLVDDEGREAQRGEVGELLVRGPYVTVGSWVGPDRIDAATRYGWYHSGDLMRQGDGDELCVVGRKKDIIIRGGSNISPVEVERVLLSHPLVRARRGLRRAGSRARPAGGGHRAIVAPGAGRRSAWRHSEGRQAAARGLQGAGAAVGCRRRTAQRTRQGRSPAGGGDGNGDARPGRLIR